MHACVQWAKSGHDLLTERQSLVLATLDRTLRACLGEPPPAALVMPPVSLGAMLEPLDALCTSTTTARQ
eukprot:249-Heterococcus_DN1.PRE.1